MSQSAHFARRFRFRRALQVSLAIGGAFNIALGVMLLVAPHFALGLLQLPRPEPEFYLQVLGVLAAMLGCYYILATSEVRRYSGVIALAIVGRFLAALTLLLASSGQGDLVGLKALAAVEAAFGTAHAAGWWSIRS